MKKLRSVRSGCTIHSVVDCAYCANHDGVAYMKLKHTAFREADIDTDTDDSVRFQLF